MPDTSPSFDDWLNGLTDTQLLAVTLLGEARGEDTLGRQMVASTIMNRVARGGWWGSDLRSVILKPWQFSCWNAADPNRPKLMALVHHPLWAEAMGIACVAIAGKLPDHSNGATGYLNPALAHAAWATPDRQVAQHLHHTFYRLV